VGRREGADISSGVQVEASIDARGIGELERWLSARISGARAVRLAPPRRLAGGYSAETLVLEARVERGGSERAERYVLRREMPEPAVYPAQAEGLETEIEIQWRTMEALARHSRVPLAPLIGFERDPRPIGAPFFVMGFVEGAVPSVAPPYAAQGFFAEAKTEERARMLDDGLRVLAQIHALDWRAAGFGWLAPPGVTPGTLRQLELWQQYAERELAGRRHPLLSEAFAWLRARLPREDERELVLSWGDARIGNMIWQDFRCACVTDFENVAIAPRAFDLGWWLMFDRWSHESMGPVPRLAGEPTREEQRALYEKHAGVSVGDTRYYEVLAAARYCAIVVRVMNRSVARGELPADQRIWLENPASVCLAELVATLR
jgi:aminoglycoside phosphotransferase (APT) family kinase protein